jgi:hypothetical protein
MWGGVGFALVLGRGFAEEGRAAIFGPEGTLRKLRLQNANTTKA